MKKLLTIAMVLLATSCSKDSSTGTICWECTIADRISGAIEHRTICNDGEEPGPFTDFEGNSMAFHCEKR